MTYFGPNLRLLPYRRIIGQEKMKSIHLQHGELVSLLKRRKADFLRELSDTSSSLSQTPALQRTPDSSRRSPLHFFVSVFQKVSMFSFIE